MPYFSASASASYAFANGPIGALTIPAILVLAYIVLSGIAIAARPSLLRPFAATNMRLATAPADALRPPASPTLRPFAVALLPQPAADNTSWGPLSLPPAPGDNTADAPLLLYAFPGANTFRYSPVTVEIFSPGSVHTLETTLPACIAIPPDAATSPQIRFHSDFPSTAPLSVGYAVRPVSSQPQPPTPRNAL